MALRAALAYGLVIGLRLWSRHPVLDPRAAAGSEGCRAEGEVGVDGEPPGRKQRWSHDERRSSDVLEVQDELTRAIVAEPEPTLRGTATGVASERRGTSDPGAFAAARRALELDSTFTYAHAALAWLHGVSGRPDSALAQLGLEPLGDAATHDLFGKAGGGIMRPHPGPLAASFPTCCAAEPDSPD